MPYKILIVDDEEDLVDFVSIRLEANGYEVASASNGMEALEYLKTDKPDFIISDVLMPEMDGFELYKKLKESPLTKDIPILILTARGKMEDTFRVLGVDDFLPKPFQADELIEKIQSRLKSAPSSVSEEKSVKTEETGQKAVPVQAQIEQDIDKNLRILVVGRESAALKKVSEILVDIGLQIRSVSTSGKPLNEIDGKETDVIILDVLTNGVLTHQLIQKLRKKSDSQHKGIILYSFVDKSNAQGGSLHQQALDIEKSIAECMKEGATASLGPFHEEEFIEKVHPYLK